MRRDLCTVFNRDLQIVRSPGLLLLLIGDVTIILQGTSLILTRAVFSALFSWETTTNNHYQLFVLFLHAK